MFKSKGLTIFEILIALAIVSILAVLATPVFVDFLRRFHVSSSTETLYNALQYARSEAIKRNATISVSFTTGDTWCYGLSTAGACSCSTLNSCNLGAYNYSTAQQTSLSTSGMTGNMISFESSHGAANASATATFTAYGLGSPLMGVSIGRFGTLQLCATGIGGYKAC